MSMARWLGVCVIGMGLLAGCQRRTTEQTVTVEPPPSWQAEEALPRYQKLYPDAQIGRVIATLPEDRLAAVADVPVGQFAQGDAVTFIGAEGALVSGEVVAVVRNTLHVRYASPAAGQRTPVVGDLAIRFKAQAQ